MVAPCRRLGGTPAVLILVVRFDLGGLCDENAINRLAKSVGGRENGTRLRAKLLVFLVFDSEIAIRRICDCDPMSLLFHSPLSRLLVTAPRVWAGSKFIPD
ncbi:hypothetical protein B0T17DRAFT_544178 [Bombardia bombarda]|uniref:Uncharacterized protein n=1 Tax=Bombardia bombarda TaxID=252184 RepID=A0AA39U550_9PEZI|nr:hypothetical protein B0T17DRAFT_544178 [Bombardia bombarda]